MYFIKSKDNYYLTEHRTWSAKQEQRVTMDFRTALREIEEARKWNPSAEIHEENAPRTDCPPTKTVEGTFRPVQMTREEFAKRWISHFAQVYSLADTVADYDELKAMEQRIAEMASAAWDRIK